MSHLMSPPTPPSEPHSPLAPAPNTHPDLTAAGSQQPAAAAPAAADVDDEMASPSSSSSSSEPEDTLEMDVGPSSFLNSARAFVSRSTKRASGRGRGKRGGKDERAAKKGKKGEEEFGGAGLGLRNGEGAEDKLLDKDAYDAMVEEVGDIFDTSNIRGLVDAYRPAQPSSLGSSKAAGPSTAAAADASAPALSGSS